LGSRDKQSDQLFVCDDADLFNTNAGFVEASSSLSGRFCSNPRFDPMCRVADTPGRTHVHNAYLHELVNSAFILRIRQCRFLQAFTLLCYPNEVHGNYYSGAKQFKRWSANGRSETADCTTSR
jgi:hypothetical protein